MNTFIIIYLIVLNFLAFSVFGIDKYKAIYNRWRISERVLFFFALLGGSLGAFIGMKVFQHKTSIARFYIGLPVILMVHLFLFFYLYIKLYGRINFF